MVPVILGAVARIAGGALARSAATKVGMSAARGGLADRAGQFAASATFNSVAERQAQREAEKQDYPPDDDRR